MAATESYAANGLNQYTSATGDTLSYDGRGNMTDDGLNTYVFNAIKQLATANSDAVKLCCNGADRLYQVTLTGISSRRMLYGRFRSDCGV